MLQACMTGIASALFLAVRLLPFEKIWSHIPPMGAHSADRAHIALRIPCQMLIQFRAQRLGQPQIHLHKTNTLAVIVTLRLVQIRI